MRLNNLKEKSGARLILVFVLVVVQMLTSGGSLRAQESTGSRTLYSRIGGFDAIAKFVDTAFPRVAANPNLSRLFKGHSNDSKYRQRQLIIEILCRESGGPCVYIGRPMNPVHAGLDITEDDWKEFLKIITGALVELKWPEPERKEFLTMFETKFKKDVIVK